LASTDGAGRLDYADTAENRTHRKHVSLIVEFPIACALALTRFARYPCQDLEADPFVVLNLVNAFERGEHDRMHYVPEKATDI
jgi:hypothetical protein